METTYDTFTGAICATQWPDAYHTLPMSLRLALQADVRDCAACETYTDGMGISLKEAAARIARRIRPASLRSYCESLVLSRSHAEGSR